MALALDLAYDFPATPQAVYSLYTDPTFLTTRLGETTEAGSSQVSDHEINGDSVHFTVTTEMPRSSLPKPVKGFVRGKPKITRAEQWQHTDGSYRGEATVTFMGPGKITGSMTLTDSGDGCRLDIHFDIDVPLPMFRNDMEQTLSREVKATMDSEAQFTAEYLAGAATETPR